MTGECASVASEREVYLATPRVVTPLLVIAQDIVMIRVDRKGMADMCLCGYGPESSMRHLPRW